MATKESNQTKQASSKMSYVNRDNASSTDKVDHEKKQYKIMALHNSKMDRLTPIVAQDTNVALASDIDSEVVVIRDIEVYLVEAVVAIHGTPTFFTQPSSHWLFAGSDITDFMTFEY